MKTLQQLNIKVNTFDYQEGKLGKPFKLSSIKKGEESKWLNGDFRSDWYYIFKYDDGTFFGIHEGLSGGVISKLMHQESIDLMH
tara:strand:+ start:3282 stop:3533 length:252 start_codon:yes stop_codon:yes gene_type:complete